MRRSFLRAFSSMSHHAIGIDFGTTNSSVARATAGGGLELVQFPFTGGVTESYRSLLYLDKVQSRIKSWSGPAAIEEYLAAETKGRLVQSLKSFLSSRTLRNTDVFGRRMTPRGIDRADPARSAREGGSAVRRAGPHGGGGTAGAIRGRGERGRQQLRRRAAGGGVSNRGVRVGGVRTGAGGGGALLRVDARSRRADPHRRLRRRHQRLLAAACGPVDPQTRTSAVRPAGQQRRGPGRRCVRRQDCPQPGLARRWAAAPRRGR